MILGYARVSTQDQDLESQQAALFLAGASRVFAEKISGAKRDRAQLNRLLLELQPGDTLLVTRLDRLARSTLDLLSILEAVGKKNCTFKSLADVWADTTTPHGRLMLTVLGGLAEFERELIKARTGEGRKRAMAAGVKFGRKHKIELGDQLTIVTLHRILNRTPAQLAEQYGVSVRTIKRVLATPAAPDSPAPQA